MTKRFTSSVFLAGLAIAGAAAQAQICADVGHAVNAVQAAGTDATTPVMKKMKEMPVNDVVIPMARSAKSAGWCTTGSWSR